MKSINQEDKRKTEEPSRIEKEESQEAAEDKDVERLENAEREEYIDVTTYYDEDYRLEIEARPENESTTEEDGERISESNENGSKKRERKEKRRVSFKDESVEEKGQRDQDSFLEIDSRHDVWAQIRGLKAEIRTLERELREEERRYGDRNQ